MFNVITPLARLENIPYLIDMLEKEEIQWHVITDLDLEQQPIFQQEWIHHYICPNIQGTFYEKCNNSINWWIDTHSPIDSQMYCILNDDDGYQPKFFDKLRFFIKELDSKNMYRDTIIVSMERGNQIPPVEQTGIQRQHPVAKLWATPENMRPSGVGVEQIILSGEILKKFKIPLLHDGDGKWITEIVQSYPPIFAPHINVWFNYFEPGRWNK